MESRKSNTNKLIEYDFDENNDPYYHKKQSALVRNIFKYVDFTCKNIIWCHYSSIIGIRNIFRVYE